MPAPPFAPRRTSLLDGIIGQQSVMRAMMLRELQGRFGRDNIGYLWFVAEPMMLATAITLLHIAIQGGSEHQSPSTIGVYPFTLLGYCVFIIFRNTFNRAEGMINSGVAMLYHAQITPVDIVLSKAAIDALAAISALIVLMTLGIVIGVALPPVRPIYVLAGIAAMVVLTLGSSMFIAAVTYRHHLAGRFVHPFTYIMFPLSGAFITMSVLPEWARRFMWWNPFMNIFEMLRYGYFESATDRYYDVGFIVASCAVALYMGLLALRRVRRDINVH